MAATIRVMDNEYSTRAITVLPISMLICPDRGRCRAVAADGHIEFERFPNGNGITWNRNQTAGNSVRNFSPWVTFSACVNSTALDVAATSAKIAKMSIATKSWARSPSVIANTGIKAMSARKKLKEIGTYEAQMSSRLKSEVEVSRVAEAYATGVFEIR